ncbi:molybdopterin converting factor subunit 1 [Fibrella sp. HMF5335]|uniref:Molybdopterin synthase sulfur carrier subunit n=1 Tax=Fibrella rubiginis TaxID=2817060 RepID=A0A939K0Y1_9BACT|nr:molybdopterin converting factor subunit 1 [Fibrella rubiginis]MBO0936577.1 molybdopterin converting factor subunit 1 [Fibrella rubiginis]
MNNPHNVLLFGITRDLVGQNRLAVQLPDNSRVADLMTVLHQQYPTLAGIQSILVAVNSEYADADQILSPTDEIALIPPVSGG